jgi:hypothetical protein
VPTKADPPAPAAGAARRFALALGAITAVGLVGRVVLALTAGFRAEGTISDAMNYHLLGTDLAAGRGYIRAFDWAISGVRVPTAEFPPLFPMLLAAFDLLGVDTVRGQEVALAVVGSATVAVIGLLAREVGGARVGLVAAGLAAGYTMLVLPDAALQAEGLYGLLVALTLLMTIRGRRARTTGRWLVVGALVGLAALTRSEGLLLVPLAVLPATRTWRPVVLTTAAAVLVLSPWIVRNAIQFGELVPLSNNRGTLLAGANCRPSWQGDRQGLWTFACTEAIKSPDRDEIKLTRRYIAAGTAYIGDHLRDAPRVAGIRVLRTFGLWAPHQQLDAEAEPEGRDRTALVVGYWTYLALAPFAVLGGWRAWRSRLPIGALLGTIGMVVLTSAMSYGNQRFRMAAEPALLVLAAIGIGTLTGRRSTTGKTAVEAAT